MIRSTSGDVFESGCDLVDVTSMHRPDLDWRKVDGRCHEHRWFVNGQPAEFYTATAQYETPTLVWVKDGEEYWEDDDEPHDVGHLECRQCGEHITPGYTGDTSTQYVPGLRWCRINGQQVSFDEFKRRVREAYPDATL